MTNPIEERLSALNQRRPRNSEYSQVSDDTVRRVPPHNGTRSLQIETRTSAQRKRSTPRDLPSFDAVISGLAETAAPREDGAHPTPPLKGPFRSDNNGHSLTERSQPKQDRSTTQDKIDEETWNAQESSRPTMSSVQESVINAYSLAHGHPLEHDGKVDAARTRYRIRLSFKAALTLTALLVTVASLAIVVQRWTRHEQGFELVHAQGPQKGIEEREGTESSNSETPALQSAHTSEFPESSAANISTASTVRNEQDTSAPSTPSHTLVVHVTGAVKNPGVYNLPAGSRLIDAIDLAGGTTKKAEEAALNLAAVAQDGQQIYVPSRGETPAENRSAATMNQPDPLDESRSAQAPNADSPGTGSRLINLNTATTEELDTLPGIGPALAERILEFRQTNGRFQSVEELQSVSGIGPKIYTQLKERVTV